MKPLLAGVLVFASTLGIAQQRRVVYENDSIRVVIVTYNAGEKSGMEEHPDALAISLTDRQERKVAANGSTQDNTAKAGEFTPVGGQYALQNTGSAAAEVMFVEFKTAAAAQAASASLMAMTKRITSNQPSANEASATAVMRTINTAQVVYASTYNKGFSDGLGRLGVGAPGTQPNENNADLVDPNLAGKTPGGTNFSFVRNGYKFTYTPGGTFGSIQRYTFTAEPVEYGTSGTRSFFTDQSAVVRGTSDNRPANVGDNPI
jgi:hypothetical protein